MSRLIISFFIIAFSTLVIYSQEVEVMISSGTNWSTANAFSSDNKLVAVVQHTEVAIWDVKTGRKLRNVQFSDDYVDVDSLWFSSNNKYLIVSKRASNDRFKIEIESGKSELVIGDEFDRLTYTYKTSNMQRSAIYLMSDNNEPLEFESKSRKNKLIYTKVKNPFGSSLLMPNMYIVQLDNGKSILKAVDTVGSAQFVFSADENYVFIDQSIYDLRNNKEVSKFHKIAFTGESVGFLPGTHTPVTVTKNGLRFWDFPNVTDIEIPRINSFKTSLDGQKLICELYGAEDAVREYVYVDLKTRKVGSNYVTSKGNGYLLDMDDAGAVYSFLEMDKKNKNATKADYSVHLYNRVSGLKTSVIENCTKGFFIANSEKIIVDSGGVFCYKYDLKTKSKTKFPTEGVTSSTYIGAVSKDHNFLIGRDVFLDQESKTMQTIAKVWDIHNGKVVFSDTVSGLFLSGHQISNDHKYFTFASSKNNEIYVYDFKAQKLVHKLHGHTGMVRFSSFSDDSKRLITSSLDGTRRVWNLEKGTPMASLISTGPKDYAIITPENYYYATKGAQKYIHFVKGMEIYPFKQFDLKYNRPDIIIESLEATNYELIEPYRKAYEKRLHKMGFSEEMLNGEFHMPNIAITNKNTIPFVTTTDSITIDIEATDTKYNLDRIMVRVNDVPINGRNGFSLKNKSSNSTHKEVAVKLSYGRNTISVSALNEKGVESIVDNIVVENVSKNLTKPNLYLLTIGASKYKDSTFNLEYASKDARDVKSLFEKGNNSFFQVHSYVLTNEEVTVSNIKKWKATLQESTINDVVCVFYAGHGVLDADLNYYLASYDIDFLKPNKKGIPYDVFEDLMDDIPARKKLLMIDACHSGEIDKEELLLAEENEVDSFEEDITFRAVNTNTTKTVGLNSSFELMTELFTDLRKASGTVIISSAGGLEFAMEGDKWKNGVFTYSLLSGIEDAAADLDGDGTINISEMNSYVRERVFDLTNGKQRPTNRSESIDTDWRIW